MHKLSMDELGRKTVNEFKEAFKTPVVVVLDNIRSLNNIGSFFRTCDVFAIKSIFLCGITATPPHREIYKTALGSEISVDWKYFETTIKAIEYLKNNNYIVYGVEQTNVSIPLNEMCFDSKRSIAFVFGNEVDGVGIDVLQLCDEFIEIPQFGTKHSLNIAVCLGIVIWEVTKKNLIE